MEKKQIVLASTRFPKAPPHRGHPKVRSVALHRIHHRLYSIFYIHFYIIEKIEGFYTTESGETLGDPPPPLLKLNHIRPGNCDAWPCRQCLLAGHVTGNLTTNQSVRIVHETDQSGSCKVAQLSKFHPYPIYSGSNILCYTPQLNG
jgi:hypothetical protein